jgi:hypothetical protein
VLYCLNSDADLILKGQEMLVVLLESGGCTVRYVQDILSVLHKLIQKIYKDRYSGSAENHKPCH